MDMDCRLVIKFDRNSLKPIERRIENLRPAKESLQEYLEPAAEYIANLLRGTVIVDNQKVNVEVV